MFKIIKANPILSICLFLGIVLLPNLNVMEVSIMEARNFITAREMIMDGHWLLTTMNGEARYEKPPLPTWLTAFSGLLFGMKSLFGMRFPAVLMIMLLCSFIFKLSQKMELGSSHSLRNAFICATSFYVIGIMIEAPWDIFTHGFMMVAIYYLFQMFRGLFIRPKQVILAGLFMGFSFLSKGPISMYALLLPFLLAYGFSYKYLNFKTKWKAMLSLVAIAIVVGGSWYLAVKWMDSETLQAIAEKETTNWSNYNTRPFYYYWSFFTQSGIWTIPAFVSLLYPYLKSRVTHLKAYKLSLFWTLFAVILLSIVPEKKSRYLMPVLIPLSINIGFYINYLVSQFQVLRKKEKLPVYFNFTLIAIIGLAFPFAGYFLLKDNLSGNWFGYGIASLILFILGWALLFQLYKKKDLKKVFILTILFFGSVLLFAIPLKGVLNSSHYTPISALKKESDDMGIKNFAINYLSPEMIWQYGDKIPPIKTENGIALPNEETFGLLVNDLSPEDEAYLSDRYHMELQGKYDLNLVSPSSKKYNWRLANQYYILTKK